MIDDIQEAYKTAKAHWSKATLSITWEARLLGKPLESFIERNKGKVDIFIDKGSGWVTLMSHLDAWPDDITIVTPPLPGFQIAKLEVKHGDSQEFCNLVWQSPPRPNPSALDP